MRIFFLVLLIQIACSSADEEDRKIVAARQCKLVDGEQTLLDISSYKFNKKFSPYFYDCTALSKNGLEQGYSNKGCELEFEDGDINRYTFDSIVQIENGVSKKFNLLDQSYCQEVELSPEESSAVLAQWAEFYCQEMMVCT